MHEMSIGHNQGCAVVREESGCWLKFRGNEGGLALLVEDDLAVAVALKIIDAYAADLAAGAFEQE